MSDFLLSDFQHSPNTPGEKKALNGGAVSICLSRPSQTGKEKALIEKIWNLQSSVVKRVRSSLNLLRKQRAEFESR